MEEPIQNFGVINLQKRKRGSDFPWTWKKIPGIFLPLRFFKIVTDVTK
jgi:hypothetical protein